MWRDPARDDARRQADRDREERIAQAVTMLAITGVLAVLWPFLIVAAVTAGAAWLAGMHPARLLRAAAASLAMAGVYVAAAAWQDKPWQPGRLVTWARQPLTDYRAATLDLLRPARVPAALLTVAPLAVPAGLAIGAALWWWRCHQMTHGLMGSSALSPVWWETRQWRRQAATARRDAAQPGRVPLTTRRGITAGTVIRAARAPYRRVLAVPLADFSRHMVIVGATGTGKTTLMIRLWAGWTRAALRAGGPRPLLVVIDAKGGHDSRAKAAQARAALAAAGCRRFATWPDVPLNMWDIAPRELAVLLHQLIEHGDGAASYYADISQAVIALAVHAPGGPPRSSADFLARLSPGWLERAYAAGRPADLSRVTAAKPHLGDIAMRYTVLLDRLGHSLDGQARLTDADAWYCILEGTAEASVAEAQAMALTELVARAATTGPRRAILLAADDYSAVSRRVPLSNLYERGRSLGLGVQVSAQSWEGLGADDDERKRITSTADGGIWLLRTPSPEPLISLAGTRRVLESGRKLLGAGVTGDEGTSRVAHTWTVDPDRIRQLDTGQAAYIRHGGATYVHVVPAPATAPAPPPPGPGPGDGGNQGPAGGQPAAPLAHRAPSPPALAPAPQAPARATPGGRRRAAPPAGPPERNRREHPAHRRCPPPADGRPDRPRRRRADRRGPRRRANPPVRDQLPRLQPARSEPVRLPVRHPRHLGRAPAMGRPLRHRGHHPAHGHPREHLRVRRVRPRRRHLRDLHRHPPRPRRRRHHPARGRVNTEFPAPWQAAAALPGRLTRGRPARITARAIAAAALAAAAAILIPGTPSAPAIQAAALLWLVLTAYPELAPD